MSQTIQPARYETIHQASTYNAKARRPFGLRRLSQWLELAALRRATATIGGESVLDAPCGTGRIDPVLRRRFTRVIGLDSSPSMLNLYRALPESEGRQGDIFHMPFDDGAFDWVVCHRFFHHLRDMRTRVSLLKSLRRVARTGVIFYAWVDTCLTLRSSSRRSTLTMTEVREVIAVAGLQYESIHYAAWPFQPKAIIVCTNR